MLHLLHEAIGFEFVAPVFRGEAASRHQLAAVVLLVDDVSTKIAERGFEHIKDEFRARRAAGLAAAELRAEELLVLRLSEVGEHLCWCAEENQFAPLVEQEGFLEHLKNLRRRLMDRHQHDLVVGHATDDLDDMLRVL